MKIGANYDSRKCLAKRNKLRLIVVVDNYPAILGFVPPVFRLHEEEAWVVLVNVLSHISFNSCAQRVVAIEIECVCKWQIVVVRYNATENT